MIAEELKKIKAFGSDRESSVTPEDIAAKEAEMGIRLPEALSQIFDWFLGPHPTEKFDLAGRPQQSPYGFVGTARQSGALT